MMGFAVFVGAFLAYPFFLIDQWINILFGFGTGFMLTAAAMIINDYYDKEIDSINEPNRPIPKGLISTNEALSLFFVSTIIGFIFAFSTSILCFMVAILSWVIVIVYVTFGKKTGLPGNFLVSICVAIPFIYGSILILGEIVSSTIIFSFMAFFSNTGREITKGIVDMEGDKSEGVKTIAAIFSPKIAAFIAVFFYMLAVFLTPIPIIFGLVSFWFIPMIIVTNVMFLISSILLLNNYSRKNAKKIKNIILLCFALGLISFLVGVSS
jgi:geranylgeranylglycerol-phosphate geranylgeranyltransferase